MASFTAKVVKMGPSWATVFYHRRGGVGGRKKLIKCTPFWPIAAPKWGPWPFTHGQSGQNETKLTNFVYYRMGGSVVEKR